MAELTLAGLRVVREVDARGSFTAAADALGYTQSAVSRQVAAMEAAAGTALFARASRGVRVTAAGEALLRHAGAVLDGVDAARRELAGLRALETGRLRAGAFPTAVAALVPRALAAFRARHPGVEVTLREGTTPAQLRRLAAGAAELAVVSSAPDDPAVQGGVELEPLLDDPLLLAVNRGHRLARRRSVALDDLAGEPWIAGSAEARETFLGAWASVAWQPRVAYVAREWTAKQGLVAAGLGVTLVPGLAASAVRADLALVRVRAERPATRSVLLATREDAAPAPGVRAFADALHETAAELTAELGRRIRGGPPS